MIKNVLDSSILISLAKIKYLKIIISIKDIFIIPEEVYKESVIEGEKKYIPDAILIKRFIADNKIEIINVQNKSIRNLALKIKKRNMAKGDEAVLAIALQEKADEILTDDEGLTKIGLYLGFRVSASPDLLLNRFRINIINFQELEINIKKLVLENRLSSPVAEYYIMEAMKNVKN
ncbi:MAG: hypothetical protein HY934_03355 [Candidatus Firestonebacteria bacterium]|nr:hypothetical protein [Candidatus Firestonebacteria bacterium]